MKFMSNLLLLLLLSLSLSIIACGQTGKNPVSSNIQAKPVNEVGKSEQIIAQISGNTLTLQNNDGKCQLLFNKQLTDLDLNWSCDFHRFADGKVRVFPQDFYAAKNKRTPKSYRDTQIILVESSEPDRAAAKQCKTELQAIKLVKGKLTKSVVMRNLASCPPFSWDEKNFTGLFE